MKPPYDTYSYKISKYMKEENKVTNQNNLDYVTTCLTVYAIHYITESSCPLWEKFFLEWDTRDG